MAACMHGRRWERTARAAVDLGGKRRFWNCKRTCASTWCLPLASGALLQPGCCARAPDCQAHPQSALCCRGPRRRRLALCSPSLSLFLMATQVGKWSEDCCSQHACTAGRRGEDSSRQAAHACLQAVACRRVPRKHALPCEGAAHLPVHAWQLLLRFAAGRLGCTAEMQQV